MKHVSFALLFGAACGGGGDSGALDEVPPDVAGSYNVLPVGTVGCDGSRLVNDWAQGPLTITGESGDLVYDFHDEGLAFSGVVDSARTALFSGSGSAQGFEMEVHGEGEFSQDDGRWVLSGTISAVLDDDGIEANDCTIDLLFDAYQL